MGEDALTSGITLYSLAVAILCVSCQQISDVPTMSVEQVLTDMKKLNGKRVRVVGYMPNCGGYDCALFKSKRDHEMFWKVIQEKNRDAKLPDFLSVGYDEAFDRKAGALAGHYVAVTGKITTDCRGPNGEPGCTDRANDIEPIAIEPLLEAPTPGERRS